MLKNSKDIEQHKKDLVEILIKMADDRKGLTDLLADILTPSEFREIATRWQIVKQLKTGKGQRDIAKDLGVGAGTITRGSHMLLNPQGGFSQALRKIGK